MLPIALLHSVTLRYDVPIGDFCLNIHRAFALQCWQVGYLNKIPCSCIHSNVDTIIPEWTFPFAYLNSMLRSLFVLTFFHQLGCLIRLISSTLVVSCLHLGARPEFKFHIALLCPQSLIPEHVLRPRPHKWSSPSALVLLSLSGGRFRPS